jgi:hypothetical protein
VTQYGSTQSTYKSLTYWKEFKELVIYKTLCDQLFDDELFAESLAISYKTDLGDNDNVNRLSDTSKVRDVLRSYRRELTPFLKKQAKKTKLQFIKMLKALILIEENTEKDFKKFTENTEKLSIDQEEKYLLSNV